MPGFTKNIIGFVNPLFGTGIHGDVVFSTDYSIPVTQNGGLVVLEYQNLKINPGCTLTTSHPCQGLIIKVRGELELYGAISMDWRGAYIPGGGGNLHFGYADIFVPNNGAAGGASDQPGANGIDGQCGGGGGGGRSDVFGGTGASGYGRGGGCGASGGASAGTAGWENHQTGKPGLPYGQGGGASVSVSHQGPAADVGAYSGRGAANAGGILIVMANRIKGNGMLRSCGSNGFNASANVRITGEDGWGGAKAGGGGGSGGGSITLFYAVSSFVGVFYAAGGQGGRGDRGGSNGQSGGYGSTRVYSITELASHTKL